MRSQIRWWRRERELVCPDLSQLIRMSECLSVGLRSGRDWMSILAWMSEKDPELLLRKFLQKLLKKLTLDTVESVLQQERSSTSDLFWRLFCQILLQAQKGQLQLSQIFQTYAEMLQSISKLNTREKSLLFIPRFQTWFALALSLSFTLVLPALSPAHYPSFIEFKRYDLFFAGMGVLIFGLGLLHWMCQRPKRLLQPLMSGSFFFYFLSIYIESGLDFVTAWGRAVESVGFSARERALLNRKGLNTEGIDVFLQGLQVKMPAPWPGILAGMIWCKAAGTGLSKFLKDVSLRETDRVLFLWEDEIRKLTLTTLVPLGFFIFLPTLFLLIGPQLLLVSL